MSTEQTFETKRIDHLGLVAGICHEISLIETIDTAVGPCERKVSCGVAVQAMVLNCLGFSSRALYLMPQYLANKPVDLLLGPGLTAEDFNDDTLGRSLDHLLANGVTEVFAQVAQQALKTYGIEHRFYHLDSSSFHLHGQYAVEEPQSQMIEITYGYSRDHRPDLKQVVINLITGHRAQLPVWMEGLSSNQNDKESFPDTLQAFRQQLHAGRDGFFVVDSALYGADNLPHLAETGATVLNQVGNPTQTPTMRWIFQVFEGINLLIVSQNGQELSRQVLNLKREHLTFLRLLGPPVEKCYMLGF